MTGFIRYASTSPIIIGIAAASSLLHMPAKPSNLYSAKKNSILTANVTKYHDTYSESDVAIPHAPGANSASHPYLHYLNV